MDLLREKLRARGHHRAQFGGDSSSSSSQQTSYSYTDNRSVSSVDNHSTNIMSGNSGSGNNSIDRSFNTDSFNTYNVSTTVTDHGAVAAGAAVAANAMQNNSTNTELLFKLADKLFAGSEKIVTQNQNLAKELSSNANSAYEGATAQANGNKTMLLIGVAVVGIVAVMAWKYK